MTSTLLFVAVTFEKVTFKEKDGDGVVVVLKGDYQDTPVCVTVLNRKTVGVQVHTDIFSMACVCFPFLVFLINLTPCVHEHSLFWTGLQFASTSLICTASSFVVPWFVWPLIHFVLFLCTLSLVIPACMTQWCNDFEIPFCFFFCLPFLSRQIDQRLPSFSVSFVHFLHRLD